MVRFLHTSDWQMGFKAIHAGEKSKEVRNKRYETAYNVIKLIKNKGLDFVVLAGDTFENHDVDEVVVKRTVDILNQFSPIPVYILPGNHDPFIPGGIWDRTSWQKVGSHVHLMSEAEEINLGNDIILFPCPIKQKQSSVDPTLWVPKRKIDDKKIRIGIAHGSLDILPESINFPISKDCPDEKGLDYMALGDWHSYFQSNRCVYSGTFEPTSYSESDSGNICIVEITSPDVFPKIEKIPCRSLFWAEFAPDIEDDTDVVELEKSVKALGPLPSLLLRIHPHISASKDDKVLMIIDTLRSEIEETALYLDWDQTEEISIGDCSNSHLPEGILQNANIALSDILEGKIPKPPCNIFAGLNPLVVQKSKNLLNSLQREEKI